MDDDFEKNKRVALTEVKNMALEQLFDEEHLPQQSKALSRLEKEIETKQKYLRQVNLSIKKLMLNNSRNMEVQTEKALWNDTTRELAYHFIEDARDGSSKSEEQIKYEFYD